MEGTVKLCESNFHKISSENNLDKLEEAKLGLEKECDYKTQGAIIQARPQRIMDGKKNKVFSKPRKRKKLKIVPQKNRTFLFYLTNYATLAKASYL